MIENILSFSTVPAAQAHHGLSSYLPQLLGCTLRSSLPAPTFWTVWGDMELMLFRGQRLVSGP